MPYLMERVLIAERPIVYVTYSAIGIFTTKGNIYKQSEIIVNLMVSSFYHKKKKPWKELDHDEPAKKDLP